MQDAEAKLHAVSSELRQEAMQDAEAKLKDVSDQAADFKTKSVLTRLEDKLQRAAAHFDMQENESDLHQKLSTASSQYRTQQGQSSTITAQKLQGAAVEFESLRRKAKREKHPAIVALLTFAIELAAQKQSEEEGSAPARAPVSAPASAVRRR